MGVQSTSTVVLGLPDPAGYGDGCGLLCRETTEHRVWVQGEGSLAQPSLSGEGARSTSVPTQALGLTTRPVGVSLSRRSNGSSVSPCT